MKLIFCILAMLCPYVYGLAQPIPTKKSALNIGDTLPDLLIYNLRNYPVTTARFSNVQKQLTILDFWASWCGACIAAFPKMHALQKTYAGKLQVLMVNASPNDDPKKIKAFFTRRQTKTGQNFTLPYLLQDSLFSRLFPYRVIPHYVWIDQHRKVIAITEADAVNEENVSAILAGIEPRLPFKNDALLFDEARDELLTADSSASQVILYSSIITAERPGLGQKLLWKVGEGDLVSQLRIFNYSFLSLYQVAFAEAFDRSNGRLEVQPGLEKIAGQLMPGSKLTGYCYELQVPPMKRAKALRFLYTDLERYFNITAVEIKKPVEVFVLSAGENMRSLLTKNGKPEINMDPESLTPLMTNASMNELTDALQMVLKTTVINETAMLQNIDIRFPANFFGLSEAQVIEFLSHKGLLLQKRSRLLPVTRLQVADSTSQLPKTNAL